MYAASSLNNLIMNWTKCAISCVFLFHFSIVGLHIIGKNLDWKLERLTDKYVSPLFSQEWEMFAPPPSSNTRMFYRYLTWNKGCADTSEFREILRPLYETQKHQVYSIGRLSYYLYNCSNDLIESHISILESIPDSIKSSSEARFRAELVSRISNTYAHRAISRHAEFVYEGAFGERFADSVSYSYHILDEELPEFKNRFDTPQDSTNAFAWNSVFFHLK